MDGSKMKLEDQVDKETLEDFELSLPREKGFLSSPYLYFYQNFWCPSLFLKHAISFQTHFQAQDTDILLVSKPKSGSVWLKALAFAILNREIYPTKNTNPSKPHPFTTSNPHQLVPFVEIPLYSKTNLSDLSECPPPRLFATHIPYNSLPESVKSSGCRIIYVCRNPLDTAISIWKYSCRIRGEQAAKLEEVLDTVCRGVEDFGPHWDHVLGYWKESLKRPNKVEFLMFEDLKNDEKSKIKRLAEFMGCPFTSEEEESRVVEDVSRLCSIGFLKELGINKSGKTLLPGLANDMFFRKGEVGDWANQLTSAMVERLNKVIQDKFQGSGLTFSFLAK